MYLILIGEIVEDHDPLPYETDDEHRTNGELVNISVISDNGETKTAERDNGETKTAEKDNGETNIAEKDT